MFQQSDLNPAYFYLDPAEVEEDPAADAYKETLDFDHPEEMVSFINHILQTWKWTKPFPAHKQLLTGKKIERLLKEHIPQRLNVKETQIEPWLRSHWNKYR